MSESNEAVVRAKFPQAYVFSHRTREGGRHFTVRNPETGQNLGPTAFTLENAWRYAAARLMEAAQ